MEATAPAGMDDPYSDGDMGADAPDKKPADDKPEGESDDATESVLPRSILAGKEFNVGDEVVLKITAMHDDSISVKYAPAKEGGDDKDVPRGTPKGMESMDEGSGDGEYD